MNGAIRLDRVKLALRWMHVGVNMSISRAEFCVMVKLVTSSRTYEQANLNML